MANVWTSLPGNARNGQRPFTSTWITDDYEYCILVRHDWHPIVCQRARNPIGEWVMHDVYATVIGLIEVTDSHMGISIAVDPDGRVHVSGNTHDTVIRHIRSVNPHDISSWETLPPIEKQAKYFTNLVENGVVEDNQDGWSSIDANLYTMDRVTHAYGWGSTHGNDTGCRATRLTRTANAPSTVIGHGTARSISGGGFPITPGEKYTTHLSFRAVMASPSEIQHQLWLVFRNGESEISRVASETRNATDVTKWYRPSVIEAVAPVGVDNAIIEFRTIKVSGNAASGDAQWVDGLMLYEGDQAGDIVYRDGSFNGGTDRTGWIWNGTPYASTSTGPIRAEGYAGIPLMTYNRFDRFSDGTITLSGSQSIYPSDPVGRRWSIWKMEPGDDNFQPMIGEDGIFMRNTESYVWQGASYPVQSTGNPPNDEFIADRAYTYGTWIDKHDILHMFCWFRVKTNTSFGHMLYVRSYDKGQTFVNIHGDPVAIPLRYPDVIGVCSINDQNDIPVECSTVGGVTEIDGRPYISGMRVNNDPGRGLCYWDGSEWVWENQTSKYGFIADPGLANIKGDLWIFGSKTVPGKGSLAVWGANHTQDTGPIVRLGTIGVGTPDGDYEFESGATYEAAPTHAGGLDHAGNYVYRRLIPDNETPVIRQFGNGVKARYTDV